MFKRLFTRAAPAVGTAAATVTGYQSWKNAKATNPDLTVMKFATNRTRRAGSAVQSALKPAGSYFKGIGSAILGKAPGSSSGESDKVELPPIDTTSRDQVELLFLKAYKELTKHRAIVAQNPTVDDTPALENAKEIAIWFVKRYNVNGGRYPITGTDVDNILKQAGDAVTKDARGGILTYAAKSVAKSAIGSPGLKGGRRRHRKQTRRKTRRNRSN